MRRCPITTVVASRACRPAACVVITATAVTSTTYNAGRVGRCCTPVVRTKRRAVAMMLSKQNKSYNCDHNDRSSKSSPLRSRSIYKDTNNAHHVQLYGFRRQLGKKKASIATSSRPPSGGSGGSYVVCDEDH
eukprot:1181565-Prorocentrum_minimum.AAC.1